MEITFKEACADAKMQMRRLDRVRAGMLCKVAAVLPPRYRMTGHRCKGRPFSYFGFLEVGIIGGDARNRLKKDAAEGRSRKGAQP